MTAAALFILAGLEVYGRSYERDGDAHTDVRVRLPATERAAAQDIRVLDAILAEPGAKRVFLERVKAALSDEGILMKNVENTADDGAVVTLTWAP